MFLYKINKGNVLFWFKRKDCFFLSFFRIAKIHGQPVVFNPVSSVLSPVVLPGNRDAANISPPHNLFINSRMLNEI